MSRGALLTLALIVPTLLFEEIGWRGVLVPVRSRFDRIDVEWIIAA